MSWSSGKDAAFTLWELTKDPQYEVAGLLTTVTTTFGRVSMHGVREELLEAQAAAAGLPLYRVEIPFPCPNSVYETAMAGAIDHLRKDGVTHIAFGDLFLQDIRAYRETRMAPTGIRPVFPLWERPTPALAREMIGAGIEAYLVCVDPRALDRRFAGRRFDRSLLDELPPGVDPCGERGEFHTFVAGGPMFSRPIPVVPGEVVDRDGFVFADLLPG